MTARGLVLGKFLPYHAGHAHLIRSARASVDHLSVLVCSLPDDPIPGALRYRWVREAHRDCDVVHVTDEVPQAPEDHPDFWAIWRALIHRHAGDVDAVFTSERYGERLATELSAAHTCVDLDRSRYRVSGSAIRENPYAHWEFLPPAVRAYYALRIAIVGAESTGKTMLAERLAKRFDTTWVPEFGRPYCDRIRATDLRLHDFDAIGWGQATWEDECATRANRILICDTDLHTTATWSDLIAGGRPPMLAAAARGRRYALTLLLEPDVPWVDDGTRVLESQRVDHSRRLKAELEAAGQRYVSITGSFDAREAAAARHIEELLARP